MTKTFDAETTAEDVLDGMDLSGKRVLVTGVSAGLGAETARQLAARGAGVVGTARSLDKAKSALPDSVELVELDLASLASVRACTDKLLADGKRFDLVIANAGVMHVPKGQTADGFETHFGTNFLGHFLLINRIAGLLNPGARIVNLTSWGHNYSDVDLDDLNFENAPYEEHAAYGRSKTANILFTVEFDRRYRDKGIRATAVHPGGIPTELYRHMDPEFVKSLTAVPEGGGAPILPKSESQGVATQLWAGLVAPADEVGGRYCEDCHASEVVSSDDVFFGVRDYAVDPQRAGILWSKAEQLVGERF
ncbi:MAG: SDR family NAD(P)-dependent oxidoreductase [Novosphingobium sp.]|nr:SDR family NAD(P)-dependent oxidoreductase [Novosphingobium sp.]MCP5403720.1 SDR family NAD(P)-dependent oxidoreductase [Novosphingobium sp.]